MNTLPELLANFEDGGFATVGPFPHQTQMSIMPVVAMKGRYLRGVGTCFAISSQGLVMTARHVIEDALEIDDSGEKKDPDLWVGAVYAAEPGPEDLGNVPDLLGGPIPRLQSALFGESRHRSDAVEVAQETRDGRESPYAATEAGHADPIGGRSLRGDRLPRDELETGDGTPYTRGCSELLGFSRTNRNRSSSQER